MDDLVLCGAGEGLAYLLRDLDLTPSDPAPAWSRGFESSQSRGSVPLVFWRVLLLRSTAIKANESAGSCLVASILMSLNNG